MIHNHIFPQIIIVINFILDVFFPIFIFFNFYRINKYKFIHIYSFFPKFIAKKMTFACSIVSHVIATKKIIHNYNFTIQSDYFLFFCPNLFNRRSIIVRVQFEFLSYRNARNYINCTKSITFIYLLSK